MYRFDRTRPCALAWVTATIAATASFPAHADAAACNDVLAALVKEVVTPNHAWMSQSAVFTKGKVRQSEIVNISNTRYLLVNGKWQSHATRPQAEAADLKQRFDEMMSKGQATCTKGGTETVGSEATIVYTTHQNLGDDLGVSDSRIWVSTSRGLPLRQVIEQSEGKTHMELRYDYANVQAPAAH